MRRVTIAVIGNAKTTRANLEALISDFVDSVDEAKLAVIYDSAPSDGQVWTIQYADGPIAEYPKNNYEQFFIDNADREVKFFLLYSEDDEAANAALIEAKAHAVTSYDLTDGLLMLGVPMPVKTAPVPAETVVLEPQVEEPAPEVVEQITQVVDHQYILSKLALISTMVEEVRAALTNE